MGEVCKCLCNSISYFLPFYMQLVEVWVFFMVMVVMVMVMVMRVGDGFEVGIDGF
jgi:hypothetical protein